MIFTETPTNPYLRVVDIPRVAEIARAGGRDYPDGCYLWHAIQS